MQATIAPSIYAKIEEIVGIIASSLPCLKSPVENLLRRWGIFKEHHLSTPSFVNDVSLPEMLARGIPRSSDEVSGSLPPLKDKVHMDSAGLKPNSSGSTPPRLPEKVKQWHPV